MSDSDEPRTGGWRLFLWWMLGFPLGGLLALVVVGSVEGVASGALGGALAGAVIGAAQWLVLRRHLRVGPGWALATALGVAIGDGVGVLLTGYDAAAIEPTEAGGMLGWRPEISLSETLRKPCISAALLLTVESLETKMLR